MSQNATKCPPDKRWMTVKQTFELPPYRLHGRVGKGVGHLGHDEAMEAGGREFDPRPGHYSRMSF